MIETLKEISSGIARPYETLIISDIWRHLYSTFHLYLARDVSDNFHVKLGAPAMCLRPS